MSQMSAIAPSRPAGPAPLLSMAVEGFAAVMNGEAFGRTVGDEALPKAMRRRMTTYDMGVARCVAGLASPGVDEDMVLASRYGNMGVTLDLLTQLVQGELLSPAKFSVAVHNAAAGAASQIVQNRGGHTAVAAGAGSLAAGLTEAWTRVATGQRSVILVYADFPLMAPYDGFDEPGPAVQVAVRLTKDSGAGPATGGAGHVMSEGRLGAAALVMALADGGERISWRL